MRLAVLGLALAACGAREEVTPIIEVTPGGATRLCYACSVVWAHTSTGCAPELRETCGRLFSDVRPVRIFFSDDGVMPPGVSMSPPGSVLSSPPGLPP